MGKFLVIVESPAKAKTIGKFLGRKYKIKASVGHIRDLPKSKLGIDTENDFEPNYITIRGKGPVLSDLKKEAKKADAIFLATDPDREGEAISWHLAKALGMELDNKNRIEFNEITKSAIKSAIKQPRVINQDVVDAQQARRTLDRLVGYKISPLLWKKIRRGLSAGRVQSVVTKLICDREKEIEAFNPEEYWTLEVEFQKEDYKFNAMLHSVALEGKTKKIKLETRDAMMSVVDEVNKDKFIIKEVKKGTKRRKPQLPFTTSSLQQEASKKIGFSTKKSMSIAQQLYEGIDIEGKGTVGLITYIRTDSTRISSEATEQLKAFITEEFGKNYLGSSNKRKKKKDIQDAHEAIRPTSVHLTPDKIKKSLKSDQYKLYKLIWSRFVASQMATALFETLSVKIEAGKYIFKTNGSKLKFEGYLKIYGQIQDYKEVNLPNLEEGETLSLLKTDPKQHFTQPPSRYSEASLVKTLEELGIGRPSTYAPTISTILSRGYVVLENKAFLPTELGKIVTEMLEEHFTKIMDKEFTAEMESNLDQIEVGKLAWKDVIRKFYKDFKDDLEIAEKEISEIEIEDEVTDVKCDKCGNNMVVKHGRYGKFLACPAYPDCKNTKPFVKEVGVPCPKCGGEVIERRSKKGRKFYGCDQYPKCDFVSWNLPVKEKCPQCNGLMVKKVTKKGQFIKCTECKYEKEVDK